MSPPSFREEKGRGDFFRENVCERRRDGDVGGENGAEDLSSRLEQRYYTAFARRQKGDGAIFFAIFRKNGRFAASGRRRSDAIFGERRRPNETKNAQTPFVNELRILASGAKNVLRDSAIFRIMRRGSRRAARRFDV